MINVRRTISAAAIAAATAGAVAGLGPATAQAATPREATVNTIRVTVVPVENSSAGHYYVRLVYTNISHHAVWIKGFSGVSFVADGNGTQVGEPAIWESGHRPRRHVLQPGQHVRELVAITDADLYGPTRGHSVISDGFRVYLPDETRALFVPYHTLATTRHVHQLAEEPIGIAN